MCEGAKISKIIENRTASYRILPLLTAFYCILRISTDWGDNTDPNSVNSTNSGSSDSCCSCSKDLIVGFLNC